MLTNTNLDTVTRIKKHLVLLLSAPRKPSQFPAIFRVLVGERVLLSWILSVSSAKATVST